MRGIRLFCLCILMFAGARFVFAAEIAIIVHKDCSEQSLSFKDVHHIYVARKRTWVNGKRIVLATLNDGDIHKQFLRQAVNKTPGQFRAFWRKLVFTGKGRMPKTFQSDREAIQYVSEHVHAIAYVDRASLVDSDTVHVATSISVE